MASRATGASDTYSLQASNIFLSSRLPNGFVAEAMFNSTQHEFSSLFRH